MRTEAKIVRLLLAYQDIWFAHFPMLSRRAEWHIVHYLCMKGQNGASVGEVSGLVKQVFLLDDATVKERLISISQLGFCELEAGQAIYARSIVSPTRSLLTKFDAHLLAFAERLSETAQALGATTLPPPPADLGQADRVLLLQPLEFYADLFSAALDRIFEAGRLSPARRLDAKRNLISSSHWNLLHNAVRSHYEIEGTVATGVLADRLAAQLLQLTGQTLQTTRDHISHLLEAGLFQRMKGKALHVSLMPEAMRQVHVALGQVGDRLPSIVTALAESWGRGSTAPRPTADPDDLTLTLHARRLAPRPQAPQHVLDIRAVSGPSRRMAVTGQLTVGRSAPADLVLAEAEISRNHCRIALENGRVVVTDLNSTNGTRVNGQEIEAPTVLRSGDMVQVGTFVMQYQDEGDEMETQIHRPGHPAAARANR